MPRSGTTLIRVLLDAHPDVRCGEETRIIPRLLSLKQQWSKSPTEVQRLIEGGITDDVMDAAMTAFILEVIVRHGKPAPRLCNKDPFTLRAAVYLHKLFPQAKFLLMIRDGRAVVHSIITRKVTITGYDLSDYRQCLKRWNAAMYSMYNQCQQLGPSICMPVYYEQLVLHPKPWLQRILAFLDVPWNDSVLHHEQIINQSGISLSKLERSTDQVIKPINLEAAEQVGRSRFPRMLCATWPKWHPCCPSWATTRWPTLQTTVDPTHSCSITRFRSSARQPNGALESWSWLSIAMLFVVVPLDARLKKTLLLGHPHLRKRNLCVTLKDLNLCDSREHFCLGKRQSRHFCKKKKDEKTLSTQPPSPVTLVQVASGWQLYFMPNGRMYKKSGVLSKQLFSQILPHKLVVFLILDINMSLSFSKLALQTGLSNGSRDEKNAHCVRSFECL
ncbi:hypothetical protein HPB51_003294 [Rhipicephalus microplus]|uniref:Protein-tyrosine sulfotransferase n=1 Tax=Rhipicephalus microplus TaxID=6941 RepID=A0A9J6EWP3_RHIMP|nr:hypothetical protein HPB51_003294 [Rhipicephalus microplus]